jgi:hypothetical protein
MKTTTIDTGLVPLFTKKSGTGSANFCPMTGPLNSVWIKEVRASRWIEAATPKFLSAWAYQTSNDGIDWTTTPTVVDGYVSTTGWITNTGTVTSVTTDPRLFVRFGIACANDTGSADVEQALGRLRLEVRPVEGATLAVMDQKVFSDGSTTRNAFHPLVGPVLLESVAEHRPTLRLFGSSGLVDVMPGYQVSDDRVSWNDGESGAVGTFGTFGSSRSSAGIDYGTSFTTFSPTQKKRWVRWGVGAKNTSGVVVEAGQASLRVDYRRAT